MARSVYKYFLFATIAAIIIFAPVARGAVRIWSVSVVQIAACAAIFAWLYKAVNTDNYKIERTRIDLPVSLFLVLAAVSTVFSIYRHDSIFALFALFVYAGIYYLLVNEFDRQMMTRLLLTAAYLGGALSLYGILQYLGFLGHPWWFPQRFLSATYVNHNHFACFLELTAPLAAAFLAMRLIGSPIVKALLAASFVFMVSAFILAQSRGAWISLAVSVIVIGILSIGGRRFNARNILIILFAVMIVFFLASAGRELISLRMKEAFIFNGDAVTQETRFKIWKGAVGIIRENPIVGTGIGTFVWAFPSFRPPALAVQANAAHNDYLEMAADMGVAAPLIFVWIISTILSTAIRKGREDPLRWACATGVLSMSLHGIVDFNFHIPANVFIFILLSAYIMKE